MKSFSLCDVKKKLPPSVLTQPTVSPHVLLLYTILSLSEVLPSAYVIKILLYSYFFAPVNSPILIKL